MFQSIFLFLFTGIFTFLNFSLGLDKPKIIKRPPLIENKGVYLTASTAGRSVELDKFIDLVQNSELNSLVIDLKDYTGRIFIDADISLADEIGSKKLILKDIEGILKKLKDKNIYTIARIAVFQDPYLAENKPEIALKSKKSLENSKELKLWRDWKGLAWVDPASKVVWDYNLDLAKAAAKLGFNEVNFDYIRFPSDGPIADIIYPIFNEEKQLKTEVMRDFFRYTSAQLSFYPVITSVDLFGMTLWHNSGLNIGQRFEDAAPYFDYICPMVYPSHYPATFEGFKNPAEHPYEIVYQSLVRGKNILENQRAKLRPWLQDFDLGAEYTPKMIKLQKQATYDAGGFGWFLWNAGNSYTIAAIEKK